MGNDLADGIWGSGQRSSSEVQELAGRIAVCAARVEQVLAGIRNTQLLNWESPAGRAYRDALSVQAAALHSALGRLGDARQAVALRARESALALAAGSGWPG